MWYRWQIRSTSCLGSGQGQQRGMDSCNLEGEGRNVSVQIFRQRRGILNCYGRISLEEGYKKNKVF